MEVKKKCNILWIFFCLSKKFGPNKGMHPLEKRTLKIYIWHGIEGMQAKDGWGPFSSRQRKVAKGKEF